MNGEQPQPSGRDAQTTILLLQEELNQTNREVMALTLDMEQRVEERTAELRMTQQELWRTNSDLLQLTAELETRVASRTQELEQANALLRQEIAERRQAEQKLQAQLTRLDLLQRITRAIGERQDLRSIFLVVLQSLEENLALDFGCFCLHDPDTETITVSAVGAHSESLAAELDLTSQKRIAIDRNGLSRCVRGQLVYEPDLSLLDSPFAQRLARGGLRALVIAPLIVESQVFGILVTARRRDRSFTSGDCEFLKQLSEHVALATHQAQLYESLQRAYEDLRRTQETVMQQERLRALGQMASGIAHDINNSISPIALYTESLLEREPNLSDRARDYLETIQRAIEDVAQTVSRMREFYRQQGQQLTHSAVKLNRLAEQVIELTRARWRDIPQEQGVVLRLHSELDDKLPDILGAESEIRDALVNLILNAVDAMPEGGSLRLSTATVTDPSGIRVIVEVRDTGVGMDDETRRRCLEPFYTTKGERGTGLGLAMVYGMAQRHQAEVEVESEPGKGTAVRLVFPVPVAAEPVAARRPSSMAARPLRILLVDDDPMLIRSLTDILESEGHFVTAADGGQAGIDALSAVEQGGQPFEIVITDLGMPYVDGRKVAAAVKAASPSTPVVLLTGWGQRLSAEAEAPPHVDRLLSKPPKLQELRAVLAEVGQAICLPPRRT